MAEFTQEKSLSPYESDGKNPVDIWDLPKGYRDEVDAASSVRPTGDNQRTLLEQQMGVTDPAPQPDEVSYVTPGMETPPSVTQVSVRQTARTTYVTYNWAFDTNSAYFARSCRTVRNLTVAKRKNTTCVAFVSEAGFGRDVEHVAQYATQRRQGVQYPNIPKLTHVVRDDLQRTIRITYPLVFDSRTEMFIRGRVAIKSWKTVGKRTTVVFNRNDQRIDSAIKDVEKYFLEQLDREALQDVLTEKSTYVHGAEEPCEPISEALEATLASIENDPPVADPVIVAALDEIVDNDTTTARTTDEAIGLVFRDVRLALVQQWEAANADIDVPALTALRKALPDENDPGLTAARALMQAKIDAFEVYLQAIKERGAAVLNNPKLFA